jgi:biotin/methionine sulfoxide reductase
MAWREDLTKRSFNASHWGVFAPIVRDGRVVAVQPFERDPDPSPILQSIPEALTHRSRVAFPAVREGWLREGPGRTSERRGADRFIRVSWERALELVSAELERVIKFHGWGSAGRFHNCKTQLHRFLAALGGFTDSVNTYSTAAGTVLARRVLGSPQIVSGPGTAWGNIAENNEMVVMFGGIPLRNTQMRHGGVSAHLTRQWLERARRRGVRFVNVSPVADDAADFLEARWLALRPHTDTAVLLGIAHTLVAEGLYDEGFLSHYCVGFEKFRNYLLGFEDGVAKDAEWAGAKSDLSAGTIRDLARAMAAARTMIMMNWSLQRADHGEQPFWAAIAVAAMLGQIGLPGGGIVFGYGSTAGIAGVEHDGPVPTLPMTKNPIDSFIPVARIADMLLNPGESFDYDGRKLIYPDIKLIYWCGGNPFHHHQDLNRLLVAWRRPHTVIVHDPWWTATARHADIVLPATTSCERNDIGATARDGYIVAMKRAIDPVGEARDDFAIFSALADRMGCGMAVHEGRSEMEFLRFIYERARVEGWPAFDEFWERGILELPSTGKSYVLMQDFRRDPLAHPLATPSGRIELFSETIASFGYDDCPGHPAWLEPREWLGSELARRYPLHLLSPQPAGRLHAQMDMAGVSQASKINGREPIRINPTDAAKRGIRTGDVVRVFNDRGALLAGAVVSEAVRPGVVALATGAWYDPATPGLVSSLEKHGNPNVLTLDKGTSRLAQGPSAQTALVEIERFNGPLPPVTAFEPPAITGSEPHHDNA